MKHFGGFPLPFGAWGSLRYFNVTLPVPFIYLFRGTLWLAAHHMVAHKAYKANQQAKVERCATYGDPECVEI